jgi:hypothetical protein
VAKLTNMAHQNAHIQAQEADTKKEADPQELKKYDETPHYSVHINRMENIASKISLYIQNICSEATLSTKYNRGILPYKDARNILQGTLDDMNIFINSGLTDMTSCYIKNMPECIIGSIYKFLDYREQVQSKTVSKYINQNIHRITYVDPSYYVPGRMLWCKNVNCRTWTVGVILPCGPNGTALISAHDPITNITHTGYHINLRCGITIYIPANLMAIATSIRNLRDLCVSPADVPHDVDYAPWGRYPHSVTSMGVYMCYYTLKAPTAPSTCCILRYIPDMPFASIRQIIDLDVTNIHVPHQFTASERESTFQNAYTNFENIMRYS